MNILPFRQKHVTLRNFTRKLRGWPEPLTRVDVSRMDITNPFVIAMIKAEFRPVEEGNRVWLVKP
jgi:hypothetical protein